MDKPKVGDTVVAECAGCGSRFAYVRSRARPRKFCSPACLRLFHAAIRWGESMHKGDTVKCACSVCGKEFSVVYAGRGRKPNRCSPECNAAAGRESFRKWSAANREARNERVRARRARMKSERINQKEVQSAEAQGC